MSRTMQIALAVLAGLLGAVSLAHAETSWRCGTIMSCGIRTVPATYIFETPNLWREACYELDLAA